MKNFKFPLILIIGIIILSLTSCQKEPIASFFIESSTIKANEIIKFENTSTEGYWYEWDFGDGQSSTIMSPTHLFTIPGEYQITLSAYSKTGKKYHTASQLISVGTFWNGKIITFSKAEGVDWTASENQDKINNNVIITRQDNQGLFNIANENEFNGLGPSGTKWAIGNISEINQLNFTDWALLAPERTPSLVGKDLVLHLVKDDIYLNLKFTHWSIGQNGGLGGFTYERSTL